MSLSLPVVLALCLGIAAGEPVGAFHYFHQSKSIPIANISEPITFNNIVIGVNELEETAKSGIIHNLTAGHHFYHENWYITDKNGGSWEYLPNLHHMSKRGTEYLAARVYNSGSISLDISRNVASESSYFSPYVSDLANRLTWQWTAAESAEVIELIDVGLSVVGSSTSVFGDLANIAFYAIEFFA